MERYAAYASCESGAAAAGTAGVVPGALSDFGVELQEKSKEAATKANRIDFILCWSSGNGGSRFSELRLGLSSLGIR